MKKSLPLLLLLAAVYGPGFSAQADTYKIDPVHSAIRFKVRHFFSYVNGSFQKFEGTIQFNPDQPEKSSVTAKIETASINTGNEKRDGDLRSPMFFDVEKYPTIVFQSQRG